MIKSRMKQWYVENVTCEFYQGMRLYVTFFALVCCSCCRFLSSVSLFIGSKIQKATFCSNFVLPRSHAPFSFLLSLSIWPKTFLFWSLFGSHLSLFAHYANAIPSPFPVRQEARVISALGMHFLKMDRNAQCTRIGENMVIADVQQPAHLNNKCTL